MHPDRALFITKVHSWTAVRHPVDLGTSTQPNSTQRGERSKPELNSATWGCSHLRDSAVCRQDHAPAVWVCTAEYACIWKTVCPSASPGMTSRKPKPMDAHIQDPCFSVYPYHTCKRAWCSRITHTFSYRFQVIFIQYLYSFINYLSIVHLYEFSE